MRSAWVIGHQGCDGLRPGNTLAAFRHALELGVDAVECDVHLTRDGRLAILHDATVDRTTDGHGAVADLTMEELHALDAGQGEPVPELDELLALLGTRAQAAVELKSPGTAGPAVSAVTRRGLMAQVTFISFRLELLAEVRAAAPEARTGALFSKAGRETVSMAREVGADLLDIPFASATPELLAAATEAGLALWVWTPDAEADLRRMAALGPAGITTNRPDLLLRILGRLSD